jgi:hypothetical protein
MIGRTFSTDFPTTPGSFSTISSGDYDVFICKLNNTGSNLLYSTYLGGVSSDVGNSIAVDPAGNAYVTGYTWSIDFPTTPGAFCTNYRHIFASKLSADGSTLVYSTYLGGTGTERGLCIAVDTTGNAYISGVTSSTDFPVTGDAFDPDYNDSTDAFIVKLSDDGSMLLYATYLGGEGVDTAFGLAVQDSKYVYVSGATGSYAFPTTPGAYKTYYTISSNYITKFDLSPFSVPVMNVSLLAIVISVLSLLLIICSHTRK